MDIGQTSFQGSSPAPTFRSTDAPLGSASQSASLDDGMSAVSTDQTDVDLATSDKSDSDDALAKAIEKLGLAGERSTNVRLSLDVDKPSGRVIGRLIDRDTGELIEQFPPERTLKILAGIREMVGYVVG